MTSLELRSTPPLIIAFSMLRFCRALGRESQPHVPPRTHETPRQQIKEMCRTQCVLPCRQMTYERKPSGSLWHTDRELKPDISLSISQDPTRFLIECPITSRHMCVENLK